MARTPLRPDIAAARSSAKFSLGSRRELARLGEILPADETVAAILQCRYQGCFVLAALTDTRLLLLADGFIWKVSDDIPLARIGLVQWRTDFGVGTLTIDVGGMPLQLTGIYGPGGPAMVSLLRAHLAEQDRQERQAREGILAMAARFTAPARESFPDEVPETCFLKDPELLPQMR